MEGPAAFMPVYGKRAVSRNYNFRKVRKNRRLGGEGTLGVVTKR